MTAIVPFSFDVVPAAKDVAEEVCRTEFVPKSYRGRREAVLAAILTGQEAGIGPMQAIAGFDVIDGSAKMKPELARALVLAAGHDLWYEDHSATKVTACGKRAGSDKVTKVVWTLDDAKRAGLAGKQNWQRYPRQMLVARATGELCSLIFGDVTKGFSSGGDQELVDEAPEVAQEATPAVAPEPVARRKRKASTPAQVAETPPEPLPEDEIEEAEVVEGDPSTPDQRKAIGAICSQLGWDNDRRRSFCAWIASRPIQSATELTKAEASMVIDALNDAQQRDDFETDGDTTGGVAPTDGDPAEDSPSSAEVATQPELA